MTLSIYMFIPHGLMGLKAGYRCEVYLALCLQHTDSKSLIHQLRHRFTHNHVSAALKNCFSPTFLRLEGINSIWRKMKNKWTDLLLPLMLVFLILFFVFFQTGNLLRHEIQLWYCFIVLLPEAKRFEIKQSGWEWSTDDPIFRFPSLFYY